MTKMAGFVEFRMIVFNNSCDAIHFRHRIVVIERSCLGIFVGQHGLNKDELV